MVQVKLAEPDRPAVGDGDDHGVGPVAVGVPVMAPVAERRWTSPVGSPVAARPSWPRFGRVGGAQVQGGDGAARQVGLVGRGVTVTAPAMVQVKLAEPLKAELSVTVRVTG